MTSRTETLPVAIPAELEGVLTSTSDTLGGEIRFSGTRIPLRCLLDTIEEGDGIDTFLMNWPDVSRAQAEAVLRWEQNAVRRQFGLELSQ